MPADHEQGGEGFQGKTTRFRLPNQEGMIVEHQRGLVLDQEFQKKNSCFKCLSSCHCALPGSIFWTWLPKLPRSRNAGKSGREAWMTGLHGGMRTGDESGTKKTICDSQIGSSFGLDHVPICWRGRKMRIESSPVQLPTIPAFSPWWSRGAQAAPAPKPMFQPWPTKSWSVCLPF